VVTRRENAIEHKDIALGAVVGSQRLTTWVLAWPSSNGYYIVRYADGIAILINEKFSHTVSEV
jgi:hypothetical protein